jgi:GNAT superfamily N-acetyltransferase
MPDMTMRTAVPSDAAAIRTLVRTAYARWVPILGREPRPMTADYEAALSRHRFDLMETDGALIALIETAARPDHYWIENLAVQPEAQGRGLGKRLLAHAETLALAAGLTELRLLTNGLMAANRALYGSLGFVETAQEPFMDSTVVYLSKRL